MNDERATGGGRVAWPRKSHERRVEAFYSIGATRFGDCHGGYLNFGLWEDGCDYLRAAENMVRHLASWGGVDESAAVSATVALSTGPPRAEVIALGPRGGGVPAGLRRCAGRPTRRGGGAAAGMQIIGRRNDEDRVLAAARRVEKFYGPRKPPRWYGL
jgi:hypothetical protein